MLMQLRKWEGLGEGHGLEEFGNPWIRSEQMKTFLLREEKRHVMKTEGGMRAAMLGLTSGVTHAVPPGGLIAAPFSQNVFYGEV